jgi:hypothetical protein
MRRRPGHQSLRPKQRRLLPLGRQYPSPEGDHLLGVQRPNAVTLGRPALRRRPPPRQTQPHATRIVARVWIRVIWACWHTGTPTTPRSTTVGSQPRPRNLTQGTQTPHLRRHLSTAGPGRTSGRRDNADAGPGGQRGASQISSAAGSNPHTGASDQPLPGPARPTLPAATIDRKRPRLKPLQPAP